MRKPILPSFSAVKNGNYDRLKAVKIFILAFLLCGFHNSVYAIRIFQPVSTNSFTGANTYCVGDVANALTFTYNTCNDAGGGGFVGGPCTIQWYYNVTNSNVVAGATTVAGPTPFNSSTAATGNRVFTPTTGVASIRYYFCVITTTNAGCAGGAGTQLISGTQLVTVNPLPTVYNVGGGGTYCTGGPGEDVTVNLSQSGVDYNLYNNGVFVSTQPGSVGTSIDFGFQLAAGTYTVQAVNAGTGCTANMNGSAVIVIGPPPVAQTVTVTNGGEYCTGGVGVDIGLSSSQTGVSYQLYYFGSPVGSAVNGNAGNPISFGTFTGTGVNAYSVVGTNIASTCTANMANTVSVTADPLPNVYSVVGGGSYCPGGTGPHIFLNNSDLGINYSLYLVGNPVPVTTLGGVTASLDFGAQNTVGTYTVEATNAATGCQKAMSGSASVALYTVPTAYTLSASNAGQYCAGGIGVTLSLNNTDAGIHYQLFNSVSGAVSAVMTSPGGPLSFGLQTTAATYTVVATNPATGCTNNMNGNPTVVINPLPTIYAVTGGGTTCAGGTVNVGLSGSDNTITYHLYRGSTFVLNEVGPTGAFNFAPAQGTAGTYSVNATDNTTGCFSNMSGGATINVNPLPTVYNVTGGGGYCTGGTGVHIGLNNSDNNFTYHLDLVGVGNVANFNSTGGSVDFGLITVAGTYTVSATNNTTSCVNSMSGSATVVVNLPPNIFNVTGGGQYCSGGTGVAIGLDGSNLGINYQLYNGSTATGLPVPGIGGLPGAISFGLQTASGTYSVQATDATTGCVSPMTGDAVVTINPLPNVYPMTGGGSYCAGGAGVVMGLANSDINTQYRLYNGITLAAGPITGTSGPINFAPQTTAGTYTVQAQIIATGCLNEMFGSETVTINPLPTAFAMTGGGAYCAGGAGVHIGLANSTTGVNYQLYNGAATVGPVQAGSTGSSIDFGLQTAAGTYTVLATNATTFCTNVMAGSETVTINPLPVAQTVNGGGSYCSGGAGVPIGLANSETGVSYQLYFGASAVGAPQPGLTGFPVNFGLYTASGAPYTVIGTNTTTFCTNSMANSVAVTILPLPAAFNVTGTGSYCSGGAGVDVGLSGSAVGFTYQLYNGASTVGAPVTGTGNPLDFGFQTTAATYTVLATNSVTFCTAVMNGGATVTVLPLPTAYSVTGGGTMCASDPGFFIGLSSSNAGISYQLYNGSTAVGGPQGGTGGAINFGLFTTAGTYSVMATNTVTNCTNGMTGSATIIVNPLPVVFNITGGGGYCAGGTGVLIGLTGSEVGVNYQLVNAGGNVGAPVGGTGSGISFGLQLAAGSYSVTAQNTTTLCNNNMAGSTSVVINPNPVAYTVTGGGAYCAGGAGVDIGLTGSDLGVDYQPVMAGGPVGSFVIGSGTSPFDIGFETTAGTYSVVGTYPITGCTTNMTGTANVAINPLPIVYNVTGGGPYCAGGAGVPVGLDNTEVGITYTLYNGSSPVTSEIGPGGAINFSGGPFTAAGTYSVSAQNTITTCSSNMAGSAVIVINPLPDPITGASAVCEGSNITLSDDNTGGIWTSDAPGNATVSSVSGVVTGVLAGVANITYTLPTTCFISTPITVNPTPGAITGISNVCVGLTNTLSNAMPGGTWSSNNNLIATIDPLTGILTGVSANPVIISYIMPTGCFNTFTETVNPLPILPAIGAVTTSVCLNSVITYTNAVTLGVWSSSNNAIATVDPSSGNITGVSVGTATITYTFTNGFGCSSFVTLDVTVNPIPAVTLISGPADVCAGATITLSDATSGGVWSSGTPANATINSMGVVTGVAFGVATISYTVTNGFGCSNSAILALPVGNAMPASSILPVGSATLCGGAPVNLVVSSAGVPATYQWLMNGSPIPGANSSNYIDTVAGFFEVIIGNGTCELTLTGTNVVAPPAPVISYDSATATLYTGSFASYQWYLDGNAIPGATGGLISTTANGLYMVIVTDANGCSDTATYQLGFPTGVTTQHVAKEIRIYPNPATSILYIDAPGKVFVSILSPDGKVLIERKEAVSINVSQLADGVYMIMIYDENNNLLKTDKFMKM